MRSKVRDRNNVWINKRTAICSDRENNANHVITLSTCSWILPCKQFFVLVLKILKSPTLVYELLNQYRACLYLFEAISPGQ